MPAGGHIRDIREKAGCHVVVSQAIPGNPERILTISGALDAIAKVSILH